MGDRGAVAEEEEEEEAHVCISWEREKEKNERVLFIKDLEFIGLLPAEVETECGCHLGRRQNWV